MFSRAWLSAPFGRWLAICRRGLGATAPRAGPCPLWADRGTVRCVGVVFFYASGADLLRCAAY